MVSTQFVTEKNTRDIFRGVKAAGVWSWQFRPFHVPIVWKFRILNPLEILRAVQACTGVALQEDFTPSNMLLLLLFFFFFFFLFFFYWHYSPLWALACRTMSFHFFLSATNSLHLFNPSTWRSLSTSPFHLFLGIPLLLVLPVLEWRSFWAPYPPPFSLGDLTTLSFALLSILIYFFPLLMSSRSRFARLCHSPFSYLGPYLQTY